MKPRAATWAGPSRSRKNHAPMRATKVVGKEDQPLELGGDASQSLGVEDAGQVVADHADGTGLHDGAGGQIRCQTLGTALPLVWRLANAFQQRGSLNEDICETKPH